MSKPPYPGNRQNVLVFVLFGTLIALAFALATSDGPASFSIALGLALLFILWVVIIGLGLIAVWTRFENGERSVGDGPKALVVFPLVAAACSLVVVRWLTPEAPPQEAGWFVTRTALLALVLSFIFSRYLALQVQWRAQVAAESRARLNALQAWIRPRFLFNALNTIVSLIHDRPDHAEQAALDLSDLLRTGLNQGQSHSLKDELALIQGYLRLEQLRLGERCRLEWQLADDLPLDVSMPPFLLQPLVENAIVHGISRRLDGGTLRIEGRKIRFARLRFTITNPLADADSSPAAGNRSALDNIRQRLALAYEERYGLKTWIEDGQFKAELTIPVS